jgi:hypothetical protein
VVGSAPLGYALAQYLIVGTRHPYSGDVLAKAQIAKTLVHEFGHILGQVPHYLPEYSLDKAEAQPQKTNDKWYNDEKGGKGSHCSTGAKEVKGKINGQTTMVFRGGSCLMFHEGNEPRPFCSRCQVILKRANLQVLGIASVWPGGWTP